MARFSKKTSIVLEDRGDPNYPVVPDVDLKWFDDLDKLHARFADVSIEKINNTFEIRDSDPAVPNKLVDPLTQVRRKRPTGGGAFYSYFVRMILQDKKQRISIYDFQKSYTSFCRRVPSSARVVYKNYYTNSVPEKDGIKVSNSLSEFDYVLSYYNMEVLSGDVMRAFFSSVKNKGSLGVLFYFDPYSAARDRSVNQSVFTFLKRDDNNIFYTLQGIDYVDPVIYKDKIIDMWKDYYDVSFLTLQQFALSFGFSGMRKFVQESRGPSNSFMWKHSRVMVVQLGSTDIIESFGRPYTYDLVLLDKPAITGKAVRPMMMTPARLDSCSSSLTWITTKIDGYQAIVFLKRSSNVDKKRKDRNNDLCGYNLEFHFRNGKVYGARIPYRGMDYQIQATVLLNDPTFPSNLKVTHIYYEDLISGRGCVGSTFSQRAFFSKKISMSGFNFLMKEWLAFSGSLIPVGENGEGLILQRDCLFRHPNGNYYADKDMNGLQTCFYLCERYTVDVSIISSSQGKDFFVLDGKTYFMTEGKSPVREICIHTWEPFRYEYIRDRDDRSVRSYTHHGSSENSCNGEFVSDLMESITIKQAKMLLAPSFNITGSLEAFYLYFRNGGILTNIQSNFIPAINYLVSTGRAVLFYKGSECDHGFYVWRDHFQRIDLKVLEDAVDFEDISFD